jgi:radical SAM superfamily enzyme YgiQ (UPF0313 family)
VVEEIEMLKKKYNPDLIGFQDPSFCASPKRVALMVKLMKSKKLYIPMSVDLRSKDILKLSNLIDLKLFHEVGFVHVFMGIESGSDRILEILNKKLTSSEAFEAVAMLSEAGIIVGTSFIHDFPFETEIDSDKTFELIEKLCKLKNVKQLHHFYTPYPMTEMSKNEKLDNCQTYWAKTSTYSSEQKDIERAIFRNKITDRLIYYMNLYPNALHSSKLPIKRSDVNCKNEMTFWKWFEQKIG